MVHVVDHPDQVARHAQPAAAPAGDIGTTLGAFARLSVERADHEPWIAKLRTEETAALPNRVSIGLREDAIQPLVIRANEGDCVQINFTNNATGGATFCVSLPIRHDA